MKTLIPIVVLSAIISAVSCCNHGNNPKSKTESGANYPVTTENTYIDSSKIRTLEAFLNIDYAKAFEDNAYGSTTLPDFSSDFYTQDPESTAPMLIFVSVPDCSACIAATLDFLITYSRIDTKCPIPYRLLS